MPNAEFRMPNMEMNVYWKRILFLSFGIWHLAFGIALADTWTLTTADFNSRPVMLKSVTESAVVFSYNGADGTMPIGQLLSLSRGASMTSPKFVLTLLNGDQLAGMPVSVSGEQLLWKSPALGDVAVSLRKLVSMNRPGKTLPEGARAQDVVMLANGDVMHGIVTGFSSDKLMLQGDSGDATPVPLDSVNSVGFATTQAPAASPSRALKVKLADGSSVTAAKLTSENSNWSIALMDSPARAIDGNAVVSIEQVNGPVSWLSSRTPSEVTQIPYLGTPWPTRFDRDVMNKPIRFGDKVFSRGIGVHAYSRIVYPLDGAYKTFRTQDAMDGDLPYADVTVRVLLDGKVVHETKNFRAGVLSPVVSIPVDSAKSLTLEVDYGVNRDTQARFNWIEPALLR
jgi:hypothetical protein